MTLMTTMTAWWLLSFFCFMIRKSKAWRSLECQAFPNNLNPRYNPLTSFAKHIT